MAEINAKPGFFRSVMSGINGWVNGLLAGGLVGAVTGAAVGAVFALITGSVDGGLNAGAVASEALVTAGWAATLMGGIGSLAGTVTGVVRSREVAQPSANDVLNVAKISYAQGIAQGHALAQQQETAQSTEWRDKETQRRAVMQSQGPTVH